MSARNLRHFVSLSLVLVLAWTSVTMAVARTQARTGTMVTLCSPAGLETIVLGPDGAPVPPPHPCPYCVIIAASTLPPGVEGALQPETIARPALQDWPVAHLCEARAPPVGMN